MIPRRAAEWLLRALLVLLSAALALAAAEAGLRLFLAPRFTSIYRIHPRYLHALVPGAVKVFRHLEVNGGGSVLVRINSRGYRGEELGPREAARRLVVYGDSIVEAEYSALPETFVERLEAALAGRLGFAVEAINAGVVGYGPDQVSLRMEDELEDLDPDLAVVVLFADNDFGDLLRNKLYRPGAGGGVRLHRPIIALPLREEFGQARSPFLLARVVRKALGRGDPRLVDPLADLDPSTREAERMEIWLQVGRDDYASYLTAPDLVTNLMMDTYDADLSLEPASPSATFKAELMEGVLARIREVAAGRRVPLLMVIVPSARDVCPGYDYGRADPARHPAYRPDRLTALLAAMAGRLGVPAVDLFGPFSRAGGCGLYFRGGEDHWNGAGQELAAGVVAEAVVSADTLR